MKAALDQAPWSDEQRSPQQVGAVVHRCKGLEVRSRVPLTSQRTLDTTAGALLERAAE